ncbi:MAG: nitroreductase/quinone reductase family protein [Acidimicrobiia bacterium]
MPLTDQQLRNIDTTKEVKVETRTEAGSTRTIIWIVVADGQVYVRSVRGDEGHWYQRALANPSVAIHVAGDTIEFEAVPVDDDETIETVSDALRSKYQPGGSLDRMVRDEVLGDTLRLDPVD